MLLSGGTSLNSNDLVIGIFSLTSFFLIGIHSMAELPLRGMELQEKEAQKG